MQSNSFIKNISAGISKKFTSIWNNPYKKVNLNWFKLKYYKHLPAGKLQVHHLFGNAFYFYSASEFLHGIKEIFIEEVYKQEFQEKPFIIDCGANIGMSVIYIKQIRPDAEIIAFEPDDKNFELLSKNIQSFQYQDVNLRKEAVWNENVLLKFSDEGSMSSKIIDGNAIKTKDVRAVKLKDFLNRKIDFLKMDIEGAEFIVLKDLKDNLHYVQNLFIEYHGSFEQNKELAIMLAMLTENNFNYYIKEATSVYDTPFVRKKEKGTLYDVQLNIFCFRINN